ncbi:MAG TPA: NAD(P)/FAD-dependent oxidoreductase [Candidatus Obscuribacterales bacterium]
MPDHNDSKKLTDTRVSVVGAGLVGSLLAIFLARRGMQVTVFERRPDMRKHTISAGRSINLNITLRGLRALERAGLKEEILQQSIPMMGRLMHSRTGELTFQPYGRNESEFGNSVSRAELNKTLMTAAERAGSVEIRFEKRITGIDVDRTMIRITDESTGEATNESFDLVIGTDGSASAVREDMMTLSGYDCRQSYLDYGYKELAIAPDTGGGFKMEKNALHIWPRGMYMLIALPNFDGSFTCTLFLPYKGDISFEQLQTKEDVEQFFQRDFNDTVPLMDSLIETFFGNPTGSMVTVKCHPWHYQGKVLLVGDAAHAIVPFFGQGANCGFEDLTVFDELLTKYESNGAVSWSKLFADFTQMRKEHADAIADMAFENFIEMRDKVGKAEFLLAKSVEKILEREFPHDFASRYSLVTFTHTPYKLCKDAGIIIDAIVEELCRGISKADEVDLRRAEKLINEKLRPVLQGKVREAQPV